MSCSSTNLRILNIGAPMPTPNALASFDRAMTQPSLLDRTTTGRPRRRGWNSRSQDA